MKIAVCIRQGLDGEINPFDACAYEEALRITGAEVTIVTMGPKSCEDFLLRLTRLGAKKAVLISDKAFAGADTLATAYTLSLAIKKLEPDLIMCGRQTLVGDTAQTGPMLSVYVGASLVTNVMDITVEEKGVRCKTRDEGDATAEFPALLTIERINTLRMPSIRSKMGTVEVWDAAVLSADPARCGLIGSPTRVLKTYENQSGRRKCKFISSGELASVISDSLQKADNAITTAENSDKRLERVYIVGQDPMEYARTISDDITVLEKTNAKAVADIIKKEAPNAVIWASDAWSKRTSSQVAAMLDLGLCADCTSLETDGDGLIMYRPALSGSIIAKIVSLTKPAMATVRTTEQGGRIVVAAGMGAKDDVEALKNFAEKIGADFAATRRMVDNGILPYDIQVGLTGKTVSPPVYIAVGVSGAVHHIVGMQRSGTVIAVNPDKDAPIFDYADYGIIANTAEIL